MDYNKIKASRCRATKAHMTKVLARHLVAHPRARAADEKGTHQPTIAAEMRAAGLRRRLTSTRMGNVIRLHGNRRQDSDRLTTHILIQ